MLTIPAIPVSLCNATAAAPAPHVWRAGEGPAVVVLGQHITTKVSMHQARGAFTLFELVAPPGAGVPPHIEHRNEEIFYILAGEATFGVGGEQIVAAAGDTLCVQRGTVHTWWNTGAGDVRMLVLSSPGGYHEPFFNEIGTSVDAPAPEGPPSAEMMAALTASAARYGIEMLPPPAGAAA